MDSFNSNDNTIQIYVPRKTDLCNLFSKHFREFVRNLPSKPKIRIVDMRTEIVTRLPLFVLCHNYSRIGDDVDTVIEHLPAKQLDYSMICMVVFQAVDKHALPCIMPSHDLTRQEYNNFGLIVDVAFLKKIYDCEMNKTAKTKIVSFLEKVMPTNAQLSYGSGGLSFFNGLYTSLTKWKRSGKIDERKAIYKYEASINAGTSTTYISEREAWIRWLCSVTQDFSPELWMNYKDETWLLAKKHIQKHQAVCQQQSGDHEDISEKVMSTKSQVSAWSQVRSFFNMLYISLPGWNRSGIKDERNANCKYENTQPQSSFYVQDEELASNIGTLKEDLQSSRRTNLHTIESSIPASKQSKTKLSHMASINAGTSTTDISEREAWIRWLCSVTQDFSPELWMNYKDETWLLAKKHIQKHQAVCRQQSGDHEDISETSSCVMSDNLPTGSWQDISSGCSAMTCQPST